MVAVCDVAKCALGSPEFEDIWQRPDLVTSLLQIHEMRHRDAIESHFVAVKSLKLLDFLATARANEGKKDGLIKSVESLMYPPNEPENGLEYERKITKRNAQAERERRKRLGIQS